MTEFLRTIVLAIAVSAAGSAAAAPTQDLPAADYPLNPKTVGQWVVLMTGLQDLARSDPELFERTRQQKYELRHRDARSGARGQGWDLEKIARDEPKVQALMSKSGIKSSEATRISTACVAAAMTLTFKQRGMAAMPGAQVPQSNLEAVKPRHQEIMRLIGQMQENGKRANDKKAQEPSPG
jgi:hypothetical protein